MAEYQSLQIPELQFRHDKQMAAFSIGRVALIVRPQAVQKKKTQKV